MTRPQEHLTDEVLAHRLKIAATEPRSCSAAERKQYMIEAALRLEDDKVTFHPSRVLAGHCPQCGGVVVIHNNHEVWPPAECPCGWNDGTDGLVNRVRLDSDWTIGTPGGSRIRLRPVEGVNVTSEVL